MKSLVRFSDLKPFGRTCFTLILDWEILVETVKFIRRLRDVEPYKSMIC